MSSAARATAAAAVLLAGAAVAHAQGSPWRVVGGGFSHRFLTDGVHGHTQVCTDPACDDADWERGNLDNAIGLRLGAERDLRATGRDAPAAGGEFGVLLDKYKLEPAATLPSVR